MLRIVDRSGAAVAASAAVVCLATLSWVVAGGNAARGERHPGGYVVVSGADPSGSASAVAPAGGTTSSVVPDESAAASSRVPNLPTAPAAGSMRVPSAGPSGLPPFPVVSASPGGPVAATASASTSASASPSFPPPAPPSPAPFQPGPTPSGPDPTDPTPVGVRVVVSPSPGPQLAAGQPQNAPADRAWCEYVTVGFGNSGATPVTSGRAMLFTQVVDLSGNVWGEYRARVAVPLPVPPGGQVSQTYELCLRPWEVPTGTHMETTAVELVA